MNNRRINKTHRTKTTNLGSVFSKIQRKRQRGLSFTHSINSFRLVAKKCKMQQNDKKLVQYQTRTSDLLRSRNQRSTTSAKLLVNNGKILSIHKRLEKSE